MSIRPTTSRQTASPSRWVMVLALLVAGCEFRPIPHPPSYGPDDDAGNAAQDVMAAAPDSAADAGPSSDCVQTNTCRDDAGPGAPDVPSVPADAGATDASVDGGGGDASVGDASLGDASVADAVFEDGGAPEGGTDASAEVTVSVGDGGSE